jgi:hypothetical protein
MNTAYNQKDFHIDETNSDFGPVVRWNSSNNVPFEDMLNQFLEAGYIDQLIVDNSIAMRKHEDSIAIRNYTLSRQKYGYTEEEKFEMMAAFGGEEVVDIFTGQTVEY